MGLKTIAGGSGGGGGGGTPGGSNGQIQVNNNGAFGGLANPAALSAISSGIYIDPRAYGAKCTGWYGIDPAGFSITAGGTGFAVNDTFLVADLAVDGRTRGAVLAKGHVTSVDGSGSITGAVLDSYGSAYIANNASWLQPLTGIGVGGKGAWTNVFVGPSAPTAAIASGGNATGSGLGGSYLDGSAYAFGDLFAVPNPATDGNYVVGKVTSTSAGLVTGFTFLNHGGDYSVLNNVACTTLTGYGIGLTLNITSATVAGNTFDDTYGIINASVAAVAAGGAVLIPDNTFVSNVTMPAGACFVGQGYGPDYGYYQASPIYPSTGPTVFAIGVPNFVFDTNGKANLAFSGFNIRGVLSGCYGSTVGVGSINGGGGGAKVWLYQMSFKNCYAGLGSPGNYGSYIFAVSQNCDYGACQYGIYGPLSDLLSMGDTFVSGDTGVFLPSSAGGYPRIVDARFEYLSTGIRMDNNGGLQVDLSGCQFDRMTLAAIVCNNASMLNFTGGNAKGCGLSGSLSVTGAANNGSGLIRLTVAGFGSNPNGGNSATSGLVTGDIANVSGLIGTTEANANQWTITVIDGSHIDLQGSTFTNTYTSGGFVNVNTKGSYVVLNNCTDVHFSNFGFYNYSAGTTIPAASVIDAVNSSRISFDGGTANAGAGSTGGYEQAFANWHNSGNTPPANLRINITGQPFYSSDGLLPFIATAITASTFAINSSVISSSIIPFNSSSSQAVSATAASKFARGFAATFKNIGTGTITFTSSSGAGETIDGQPTLTISPNTEVTIYTDQTNWFTSTYGNSQLQLGLPFALPTGANTTPDIALISYAPFNFTIVALNGGKTSSGTITAAIQIAGNNVTGLSAVALSSTPGNTSASASNTVLKGQRVAVILSSNASAQNVEFTLQCIRTS